MKKFNEKEYLEMYPDVQNAVKEGIFKTGKEHYNSFGKSEGRASSFASKIISPRAKAVFNLIDQKGLGLEIGPSHNPIAPKKGGYNVHILDHLNAEELRAKYQGHDLNLDNIEEVDFVWKGQALPELIGNTHCYDWIIASHVIEHVPNFISFLQQCELLLKPKGVLSLVVPDKRYCFDYFQVLTTTGMVLDAFQEIRTSPTAGQVFDHFANAATLNGAIAWSENQREGADGLIHNFADAKSQWERRVQTDEYIDVHCWRFTPESFNLIIADLVQLGLINLEIRAKFPTSGCEFYVTLGLASCSQNSLNTDKRLQDLDEIKMQDN